MVQALPWCSWVRGFSWVSVGIRASSFFSILAINRLQLSPRWLHSNASKPKQLNLPAFSSYYSTPSSSFLSKATAPTNNVHALRGALCCVGVKLSALLWGGGDAGGCDWRGRGKFCRGAPELASSTAAALSEQHWCVCSRPWRLFLVRTAENKSSVDETVIRCFSRSRCCCS